jgi:hypothetical protein
MPKTVRPIRVEGDVAYIPLTQGYEAIIDTIDRPHFLEMMMSKIDDGGPAFPVPDGEAANRGYHGLSMRDWFAGQALAGLLAHASGEDPHKSPGLAFKLADDMLKARKASA